ncbi:hypothetical protein [uncultured Enterococcus sp.]|uniref:hypothetical protein n=1 Tax=uncultured Enterococcus sp. TaxID=167972 RepID=UPI002592BBF8|nr:hypothetical protein [uncultured Enterococcus sp.]
MYVKPTEKVEQINFLASAKFQSFTYQAEKTYKAGEVYPANDATAIGIVLNDVAVDDTTGPQPAAILVDGFILIERLATQPADAAVKALKNITFLDANKKPKVVEG